MRNSLLIIVLLLGFLMMTSPGGIASEDIPMAVYTAPDESFSFYYPRGWTVEPGGSGFSIYENPSDPSAMGIDVMLAQLEKPDMTSSQVISALVDQMKEIYPDIQIDAIQQVSTNPDISGATFHFSREGHKIGGFSLSVCHGGNILWADIYGARQRIARVNYIHLLLYVLQSMNSGPVPNTPPDYNSVLTAQTQKPAQPQPSAGSSDGAFMESATKAHMWNMAPYLMPSVFQPLPPIF